MMKMVYALSIFAAATSSLAPAAPGLALRASLARQEQDQKKPEEKDKSASAEKTSGPLGSEKNPVRCEAPRGERAYLSRLRCSDGKPPVFSRAGSFGVGPYGNILDVYRVKCEDAEEARVFMDMYHQGHVEKEAVPGFTITDQ